MRLNPSDIIDIARIVASLVISIVAIVISIKTLRQNSKMIEESTRPNIQIYPVYLNSIVYIVIKNFGNSEAYVDEITCNHTFTKEETLDRDLGPDIFNRMQDALICPGHSIKCPLTSREVSDEAYTFKISYHSSVKSYTTTFNFNPHRNAPFADVYPSGSNEQQHLKNIARELRDIVKSTL